MRAWSLGLSAEEIRLASMEGPNELESASYTSNACERSNIMWNPGIEPEALFQPSSQSADKWQEDQAAGPL